MKPKILYLYPKHLLNKKYFNQLAKKFKKGNFIFIDETKKNKIFKEAESSNAIINCPQKYFNNELLKKSKKLQWVHTGRAGVEDMIFDKFQQSNITLTCGKVIQGPGLADHAVALILYFSRNIGHDSSNRKKFVSRPIELKNKTCGIIGLGGAGMLIAERLKSFGMRVIGFSDDIPQMISSIDEFIDVEKIYENLKDIDVLVCAAPLTNVTKNFINYDFFKKMKKDSIFINISRGKIVNLKDLVKNRIFKKFKGLGLDVTDPEPLSKNNLLKKSENVLITNHSAGLSDVNRSRSIELLNANLNRFFKKMSLLNVVDKYKGY